MNRTKRPTVLWIAIVVILISLVGLAFYLKNVSDYKQAVLDITFQKIDIHKVPDGTYIGECNVDFIYAKVQVVVQAGEIADIHILEHKNDRGKTAETVIDHIISQQIIDVDTVSGATNSSKVLKKAVENAITGQD